MSQILLSSKIEFQCFIPYKIATGIKKAFPAPEKLNFVTLIPENQELPIVHLS